MRRGRPNLTPVAWTRVNKLLCNIHAGHSGRYWEIVELSRKLILSGLVRLARGGTDILHVSFKPVLMFYCAGCYEEVKSSTLRGADKVVVVYPDAQYRFTHIWSPDLVFVPLAAIDFIP